jgi:hypothetical protein
MWAIREGELTPKTYPWFRVFPDHISTHDTMFCFDHFFLMDQLNLVDHFFLQTLFG